MIPIIYIICFSAYSYFEMNKKINIILYANVCNVYIVKRYAYVVYIYYIKYIVSPRAYIIFVVASNIVC